MDRKLVQKLVEQARKDPKFLHALVFEPESVLKQVDYVDRSARARLVGNSPEDAMAAIFGVRLGTEANADYAP
jgi:hypothetical protein